MENPEMKITRCEAPASAGKSSLNPDTLNQLLGQMVDLGAAVNGALVVLGDELGLYATLANIGPATSQELAEKTGLDERQLREWLSAQAASNYVTYDAASEAFFLTPEQTAVFADPNSPAAMTGGFYSVLLGEIITIAFFAGRSGFFAPVMKPT